MKTKATLKMMVDLAMTALFLAIGMLMAPFSALAEDAPATPVVYMTTDISPAGLMAVY